MALAGAVQGRAPFAASSPETTVLSLQLFLAVLSAPFLVLAAVIEERRRATAEAPGPASFEARCARTSG